MCGITGIAGAAAPAGEAWLGASCDALAHRGPDASGQWWSGAGDVGLRHRRLAVIDLSPSGAQPMLDREAGLALTFNGEIFNFQALRAELEAKGCRFVSRSDTEVLLAAYRIWGAACLERLHGQFAFGLHDARASRLLLARDRAGEKPLFYTIHRGALRFASEVKALLADASVPRVIDPEALDCYLTLGYVPGERAMLGGIRKLPPAHGLEFDTQTGALRTWRYWSPPEFEDSGRRDAALTDEAGQLLEAAVRRQLVADVPVGILLSGGVDSSLITAMAARALPKVRTFTVRLPGHGRFDETAHARLVADHFGTEHTELEAGEATADLFPLLARQCDDPIVDSSIVPTFLVTREVRRGCTVALGGDGGDELFGGYTAYSRLLRLQRATGAIPRPLRALAAAAAGALLPTGFKGRNWLQGMAADYETESPLVALLFDRRARARLLAGRTGWPFVGERVLRERTPPADDPIQRATRMDFANYLPEDLLVKVDRASMLNSLEVRAPFLDVPLMEFAFGRVPSRLKATEHDRKILLKQLSARLLPPAFDRRRKQGFSIPVTQWIASGAWNRFFREVLFDPGQTLFDHREIERMLAGSTRLRQNGERLFGLVMFELWRREYGASL